MSATVSATAASSSSREKPSQTPAFSNSDNAPSTGLAQSSSILFGFLITFIVLFIAFMACGIGTRRNRRARRLEALAGIHGNLSKQRQPELWDVWVSESKLGVDTWDAMNPLAASLKLSSTLQDSNAETSSISSAPVASGSLTTREVPLWGISPDPRFTDGTPTVAQRRPSPFRRSSEDPISDLPLFRRSARRAIAFLLSKATEAPPVRPSPSDDGIEGLRVAVMVAMPSPKHRHSHPNSKAREALCEIDGSDRTFGEVALGVADVSWNKSWR